MNEVSGSNDTTDSTDYALVVTLGTPTKELELSFTRANVYGLALFCMCVSALVLVDLTWWAETLTSLF